MKIVRSLLLPVLAVGLTALALWLGQRPSTPTASSLAQVQQEAEQGGYRLITTDELWQLYRAGLDGTLLVDNRQSWEYRAGHIQGAVNFPMEPTWWARWRQKGALGRLLGADKQRTIVFY